jgi:dTDP-4-dehydrorhamnose reductase
MKILVLGSEGQLGRCINDQLINSNHQVFYMSRAQFDIVDPQITRQSILEISPDVLINAAAYTAVDKAEAEEKMAVLVNHIAVKNLAKNCKEIGCWLIHISTDYVFDGKASVAYTEKAPTNPLTVYGVTKLLGERAIKLSGCNYLILRTSWVYSEYGKNFLKTILRLADDNDNIDVVNDQYGCPTYAQDIAKAILLMIDKIYLGKAESDLFHFSGTKICSWHDFAERIISIAQNLQIINSVTVAPIASCDFKTPAKRPAWSVLDNSKFNLLYGSNRRDSLDRSITQVLQKLNNYSK